MRTKVIKGESREKGKKKTLRNSVKMAASEQQKDDFLQALRDLVGIHFEGLCNSCGILFNPWALGLHGRRR